MFPDLTGPKLLVTKKTATLKVLTKINLRQKNGLDSLAQGGLSVRIRPRFCDQIGHETMYASSALNHVIVRLTKIMNNLLEHMMIRIFKVIFCVKNWLNLSKKKIL